MSSCTVSSRKHVSIHLQADELSLKSSPSREAEAVVVEARMDKGKGPVATVIMRQGTLKPGQLVVVGTEWGKIKALRDYRDKVVKRATGGQPVELIGLRGLPQAGDELSVVVNEERARRMAEARARRSEEYRHSKLVRLIWCCVAGGGCPPRGQEMLHQSVVVCWYSLP